MGPRYGYWLWKIKMKNWDKWPYLFSQHLRAFPTHSWRPKPPPARLCGLQQTRTRALIQPSSCHRTAAHSSCKQQLHPQCLPLQQQLSRTLVIFITTPITISCSTRNQWKAMGPIHSINSIKLVQWNLHLENLDLEQSLDSEHKAPVPKSGFMIH